MYLWTSVKKWLKVVKQMIMVLDHGDTRLSQRCFPHAPSHQLLSNVFNVQAVVFYIYHLTSPHLTLYCLSGSRSVGNPRHSSPQPCLTADPKLFPGQPRDIISPSCPYSALGSPSTCSEHLPRQVSGRRPAWTTWTHFFSVSYFSIWASSRCLSSLPYLYGCLYSWPCCAIDPCSCPSLAIFSPHLWTRPQDTWNLSAPFQEGWVLCTADLAC